jgi:hypothetical protein
MFIMTREKLNAVVKEINGPQVLVVAEGERFFLQGIDRPKDVKVGDRGKMVYRTSASTGLWYFVKEKSILTLIKEHQQEIKALQESCPHPKERIRIYKDNSVVGKGSRFPSLHIICQRCGKKKIVFDYDVSAFEMNPENFRTLEKHSGDERFTTYQHEYELEEKYGDFPKHKFSK